MVLLLVLMESLRHLFERLDSFWHLRWLELKADYIVEVSVHTIILFRAKSTKMLMIYINGRRFGAQAFITARFRMRIWYLWRLVHQNIRHLYKSSTSLQLLHKRELSCERLPRSYNQLSSDEAVSKWLSIHTSPGPSHCYTSRERTWYAMSHNLHHV